MTNNDELAMQAESIIADMKLKHGQNDFYAPVMTWDEFSILRAEREADKKLIADSVVLFDTLRQRIADLEARQLDVIVPPRRCFDYAALAVQERDEQWHKALHDACKRGGFKMEVGE